MTTTEDLDRIALMHTMLAVREHELRLASIASPTTFGTCTSVGHEDCAAGVVREQHGVATPCDVA